MFRKLSHTIVNSVIKNCNNVRISLASSRQFHSASENVRLSAGFKSFNCINGFLNNNLILDPTSNVKIKNPGRKSLIDSINDLPLKPGIIYNDILPNNNNVIEDPSVVIDKQAARLIVIRRRKMKRHRLKKLRKRMKFEWAKVRQKREMRKEKAFQTELMGKIKEAKKFDPAAYAAEKIRKANEVVVKTGWEGKDIPEEVLSEMIDKKQLRIKINLERAQKRKTVDLDPTHYKY